ncbi:hypothetical protein O1611_g3780 [Lasiodiplodia mahajangana]|uniref:Uncharacterized protein n=1 Tax=Lasiodiplodia mahajangana TaxID=1108764 RepID=A0ACC2JR63_9PEZI|nr:hypothetical protein O1611_g3780 [Lasiodiplodia mahajangana]
MNNKDLPPDMIDLHGQQVDETKDVLTKRIRADQRKGHSHLHVIVGRGSHSKDGIQKIKPAVEELCEELGLGCKTEEDNAGRIYINLQGGDVTDLPPLPGHPTAYNGQQHNQHHGGHQQQHYPAHEQQHYPTQQQQQHYPAQQQHYQQQHNQQEEQYDEVEKLLTKLVKKYCCMPELYRHYGEELPRTDNEVNKPKKRGLARWLTLPFNDEVPSFCQACESQRLDFRPLIKEPSQFECPYESCEKPCYDVGDDDLTDLEMKNAVYINGFSPHEAEARKSQCSLCALLFSCVRKTLQDNWLLYMPCVCILRPRYDRVGKKTRIVHRYQVWVGFQPIEGEVVLNLIYVNKFGFGRKGKPAIPRTINLKLPRGWLQQCDQKHSHPAVPDAFRLRMWAIINRGLFRALNTSTGSIEIMTSIPKFVALSYVWGSEPDQSNYQPLESRPVSAYAPTIRDAAVIAKSVGLKWLWVDRVCIDQTSRSEKEVLIPYMKDIFATAQFTIVAGSGDGAQSGLLGSPGTPRECEKSLKLNSSMALLPVSSFDSLHNKSVWSKRGWTFEEFLFSRRLLFVFSSEIFFICGTSSFRESAGRGPVIANKDKVKREIYGEGGSSSITGITSIHQSIQSSPAHMPAVLEARMFVCALQEYTSRNLTVEADRVAAFAGVILAALTNPVDEISERALLRHGHPLRFFEILLTWQEYPAERKPSPMPSRPFAPSWSWASSYGQANFYSLALDSLPLNPDVTWFQYSLLHNHDVLALPTRYHLIPGMIQLKLPDELITDQPWMKNLSSYPPPDQEERPPTGPSVDNLLPLPKLHMVTVVFDARFALWVDPGEVEWVEPEKNRWNQYVLISVGSTETSDEIYNKFFRPSTPKYGWSLPQWSIHPDLQARYCSEGTSSRPSPFESFTIITGQGHYEKPDELYYDLYIMLLGRTGQDGTYTRVGMTLLRDVKEGSYYMDAIKNGRPRWEWYILATRARLATRDANAAPTPIGAAPHAALDIDSHGVTSNRASDILQHETSHSNAVRRAALDPVVRLRDDHAVVRVVGVDAGAVEEDVPVRDALDRAGGARDGLDANGLL